MSDIFVSFLQFYIYGNTLYNWNTLYTLNNILLCLIVVGGHFEQNSQEFSLGSILLYPSTIRHKTVLNLFCYICESIYWNILKRLYSDDNIPWYLLNVFCCIYYKDYIYWNIFLRSWNTLKIPIKTKSVFSANLQFLMMSANKKINGEAGKRNLLKKWFYFMSTSIIFSCFPLRWRNNSEEFQFTFLLISFTIEVN